MKYYVIEEELAQELVNYLTTKPYAEVAQGIQRLSSLPELTDWVSASGKILMDADSGSDPAVDPEGLDKPE